jgi:hypothetical protein
MERVRFEQHQGKQILIVDVSNFDKVEESITVLTKAREVIGAQAPKSLLLITNVANSHYDPQAVDAIKKYSAFATPYLKASAVVGVGGIKRVVYQAIIRLTGRNIPNYETEAQAKDWLVGQ